MNNAIKTFFFVQNIQTSVESLTLASLLIEIFSSSVACCSWLMSASLRVRSSWPLVPGTASESGIRNPNQSWLWSYYRFRKCNWGVELLCRGWSLSNNYTSWLVFRRTDWFGFKILLIKPGECFVACKVISSIRIFFRQNNIRIFEVMFFSSFQNTFLMFLRNIKLFFRLITFVTYKTT